MQNVYIIAEAGINHGGDMAVAARMVEQAACAGADAIKFQSFTAAGLAHSRNAADQFEFFSRYELSAAEHRELAALCANFRIDFLSTPFDTTMLRLLIDLGVPAVKIASCDLTNTPLIAAAAASGKPLYISTGMGSLDEARAAYEAAREAGSPRVVMLQCTTNYPAAYPDVHLRALTALRHGVGCEAGFSDHSVGNWCCFGAVALGAVVIEKHFCLDKTQPGPDIACSCDPAELAELVAGIRALEQALGSPEKVRQASETDVAQIARRGVYFARGLQAGAVLCADDLCYLRPAGRLAPADAAQLLGRVLAVGVESGAEVLTELFA